nr:paramyosin-like [Cherax quadricarinatus]
MTDTAMQDAGSEEQTEHEDAPVSISTPQDADEGEETVTVEEVEAQLRTSQAETAAAREEIRSLTQQLATSVPRAQALMARKDLERRIDTLTRENQVLTESVEKEQREREWLEGELRAQYEAAEGLEKEMTNLQTFVRNLHALVEEKTNTLDMQKEERENMARLLEEGKEEVMRLKKEAEGRARVLARVEAAYKETLNVVKLKEEDIVRLQKEASSVRRQYEQLEKTVHRQDQRRADTELQLKNLRGQLKVVEKQAVTEERQRQKVTTQADKLKRERDMLHRTYVKTLGTVQKHAGLVHIREVERQNVERELTKAHRDLMKQDGLITALQHARNRQMEETARVEAQVVEMAAEVETQGREVQRALHTQVVTEAHLQQTSTLADALKTDNASLTRQLRNIKSEKEEVLEECRKAGYLVTKLQRNLDTRDHDLQKITSGRCYSIK